MSELGETTSIVAEPEQPKEEEKKVKIRYCVFFDGTLNNRTNIDQRLISVSEDKLTDEERKAAADLKMKMTIEDLEKTKGIYKKYEGVGSYENGYTNVVKMERHVDTSARPAGYQLMLKTYIEGPGTRDKKSDKMFGYALGTGVSGIKNKVEQGVVDVVKKVKANHLDKETRVEKLTLDVFGFSRGAAAARNFIHEALLEAKSVEQQLKDNGYKVDKVEVCFAGLFDTVSSHGLSFSNDTSTLNLDAVSHAKEVVQLAAADEHRENFSLTTIKSAGGNGREIYLPGVHSDVGGSYRDGASEDQDIYWTMGVHGEEEAGKQIEELVAAGWYTKNEITLKRSIHDRGGKHTVKEVNLHATRNGIHSHYSRIPLHIMAKYARDNNIIFKGDLDRDEKIPSELGTAQQEIQQYVAGHDSKGSFSSKASHWHGNSISWLPRVRHDYFHFSARLEFGNGPRFIDGKRQRMTYDG